MVLTDFSSGGAALGTAFLACEESFASPGYRELLFDKAREETVLSAASGRLARGLPNRLSREMGAGVQLPPDPRVQAWLTERLRAAAAVQDRTDLLPLWAGQAAPLIHFRKARALFDALVAQASVERDASSSEGPSSLTPETTDASGLFAPTMFSAGGRA